MTLAGLILGLVTLQRLGELALSKRNADDRWISVPKLSWSVFLTRYIEVRPTRSGRKSHYRRRDCR
jgi:hypothetical protein